ncbi:MAG: serine/threonine protein kinase [Planctomycetes bacterium]|nr:serine/threonine protein kinase [Planctomycetota bacterium]
MPAQHADLARAIEHVRKERVQDPQHRDEERDELQGVAHPKALVDDRLDLAAQLAIRHHEEPVLRAVPLHQVRTRGLQVRARRHEGVQDVDPRVFPVFQIGRPVHLHHALGLDAIHRAGAIHRDLKPSNTLIRRDGTACILDLGLVRGMERQFSALTQSGSFLGTPAYMAPEPALDPRKATATSDQYSLGATLFHALCGAPPFRSLPMSAILVELQHGHIPRMPDEARRVPSAVRALVEKLMAADAADRYPGLEAAAAGIADALKRPYGGAREGSPDTQEPGGGPQPG